jgi:AraC-like DNA-binding protein
MEYLTRWRMLLAAERIARDRSPISLVARALGYESESAFGAAFKRMLGVSPLQFAKRALEVQADTASPEAATAPGTLRNM